MKKMLCPFFLLSFVFITKMYAQNATIVFGENLFKPNLYTNFDVVIPESNEYSYARELKKMNDYENVVIEKVSKKTGESIWKKKMPFKPSSIMAGEYIIKIDTLGKNYIVFIKQNNPDTKQRELTAQLMDENMRFISEKKTVATTHAKDKLLGLFQVTRKGNFYLIHGSSSSVKATSDPGIPSTFTVIDTAMNQIWTKDISLPPNRFFQLERSYLDSSNNLTAVYKSSFEKDNLIPDNQETDKPNYRTVETKYEIFSYNYRTNTLLTQTISLASHFKFFGDDHAQIDSVNNSIRICGQYNKQRDGKGFEGVFLIEFDLPSMSVTKTKMIAYSHNIIAQFLDNKKAQNGHLPEKYFIRKWYQTLDGEYTFIFEEYDYYKKTISTGPGQMTTVTTYTYGNLIICHSASDSEMSWCKKIAKNSTDQSPHCLAHYSFTANNIVYLLFNATSKSVEKFDTDNEYVFRNNQKDNVLMMAGYDQNGREISNHTFVYEADRNFTWVPHETVTLSPKTIGVYFRGKSTPGIDYITQYKQAYIFLQ